MRLGVLWFLGVIGALVLGPPALALLYGVTAAGAGAQAAGAWPPLAGRPLRLAAGALAAAMAAAALLSAPAVGLVVLVGAVATVVLAASARPAPAALGVTGLLLPCWLATGLAAAAVVLIDRLDTGAAVTLVLLVSAYESGDFLIGSGATNRFEGPVVGMVAVLVVGFATSVVGIPPFELRDTVAFACMAALLAPVGQWVASLVLPTPSSRAPALRRLDSLLVLAPAWLLAVDLYVRSH
ncbi:MAG: hypothetical protein IPM45_09125 [Acidimicrobiales bacterium]|nr:hypothetical protein [Acidimicrobiales bacterium]